LAALRIDTAVVRAGTARTSLPTPTGEQQLLHREHSGSWQWRKSITSLLIMRKLMPLPASS
jgi:hypothetical protein